MRLLKWLVIFGIVIVALIAGGVIFSQNYKPFQSSETKTELPNPQPIEEVVPQEEAATIPAVPSEVNELKLTASSFVFSPATLKVKKDEKVRLVITNKDIRHTFTIDELDVDENLPADEVTTLEFTPEKKGTFTFYCKVPGHKTSGMEGKLVVE